MTWPLEGSRDVQDGIIVSMVPDICLTPAGGVMVPVPYTIWCFQANAANLANSVRQTDDRSHAVASIVVRCYGDEPGTGGGIYSGTTGAECTPKTWSQTVRAEGRNMVRHTDLWWMNHRNTYGNLIYLKDLHQYGTPDPEPITPQLRASSPNSAPISVSATPQIGQSPQADAGAGPACHVQGAVPSHAQSSFWSGYNWNSVATFLGLPHVGVRVSMSNFPPGYMAGDKGAEEGGRRNGVGQTKAGAYSTVSNRAQHKYSGRQLWCEPQYRRCDRYRGRSYREFR